MKYRLPLLFFLYLAIITSCQKCEEPMIIDNTRPCDKSQMGCSDFGFRLDRKNYVIEQTDGPNTYPRGEIWQISCNSDPNKIVLSSWVGFNWKDTSWHLQVDLALDRAIQIQEADTFTLREQQCFGPNPRSNAYLHAIEYRIDHPGAYGSTDSTNLGYAVITHVEDGSTYGQNDKFFVDGYFYFEVLLGETKYKITNGYFNNTAVLKQY